MNEITSKKKKGFVMQNALLKEKVISPLIIFLACIVPFAPQIPFLGFMLDCLPRKFLPDSNMPGIPNWIFRFPKRRFEN
jgi:hypothetical protein